MDRGESWERWWKIPTKDEYFTSMAVSGNTAIGPVNRSGAWRTLDTGMTWERVGLDAERVIEPCAVLLPRDRRGQFDQLRIGQVLLELLDQSDRHLHRRRGHRRRVAQRELLRLAERVAGFELRQVAQLRPGDAVLSAHGRADINSEGTPDERGGAELRQGLDHPVQFVRLVLCHFHECKPTEQLGMKCVHFDRHDHLADLLADYPVRDTGE